jgi:isopentenyldiphosphate isomerase
MVTPEQDPAPDFNSPDELLAVVNDHDEETGVETRRRIHETGILHRAVHVLVFDPEGRFIIQQRSTEKDTYPLHWECVGGHLGPGEPYAEAAVREVEEELGVPGRSFQRICKIPASEATGLEFIEVFRAILDGEPVPSRNEILAIDRLLPLRLAGEIEKNLRLFSPVFVNTLRHAGFPHSFTSS